MDNDINIDLSQFHGIFFDECSEGIDVMEAELLKLDVDDPDLEAINAIFRAAHSIKGSAGTFGFEEIAGFTHELETVLDGLRDQRLKFSSEIKTILLSSVDSLTGMIECSKDSKPIDNSSVAEIQQKLSDIYNGKNNTAQVAVDTTDSPLEIVDVEESSEEDEQPGAAWHISFYPHENLFFTGNDPFRLLRELKALGRVDVHADYSKISSLSEIDPENCYLGWDIVLYGNVTLNEINEIFAWVEEDCELDISLEQDERATPDRRAGDDKAETGRRKTDKKKGAKREGSSIRVGTEKVDELLNLVGELVITQSILSRVYMDMNVDHSERFIDCLTQLERNTRDLQEQTMSIRMLPIDFAFQRLPRMVHDLSQSLAKKVELNISGESTELDKNVLEKIGDPLLHLVRNALDHGIESPEVRIKSGKPEIGCINVNAHHVGGSIIIEISDDGAGVDVEKIRKKAQEKELVNENTVMSDFELQNLIFMPGFSTSTNVTDVSGRGVGMDVVKRNITDLGGTVELSSQKGVGSKFTIRLPLTLAILDGQMVQVGEQTFIVPLHSIVETVQVNREQLNTIADNDHVYKYRAEYIPIINLQEIFNVTKNESVEHDLLVIVDIGDRHFGFRVDDVIGQQQVVIKSLETNFKQVQGIAGATVLGDGSVALILDVLDLSRKMHGKDNQNISALQPEVQH